MKAQDAIPWLLLAAGGYVLYRVLNFAKDTGEKAIGWTADKLAAAWLTFSPLPPNIEVLGNIKFPGNLLVPLYQLKGEVRRAPDGNTYVRYAGYYWKLAPSDANGNWPATRVDVET